MTRTSRYLVFEFDNYYPCGGMGDVREEFNSFDKAVEHAQKSKDDYVEIYDRLDDEIYDKDGKTIKTDKCEECKYKQKHEIGGKDDA